MPRAGPGSIELWHQANTDGVRLATCTGCERQKNGLHGGDQSRGRSGVCGTAALLRFDNSAGPTQESRRQDQPSETVGTRLLPLRVLSPTSLQLSLLEYSLHYVDLSRVCLGSLYKYMQPKLFPIV